MDGGGVVTGAGGAAHRPAEIIGDHIVVTDAIVFPIDSVEQLDQAQIFDLKARFFAGFAAERLVEGFTNLDQTAGDRPAALHRFVAALDEQHAAFVVDDNGTDTHERHFRKFSLHPDFKNTRLPGAQYGTCAHLRRCAIIQTGRRMTMAKIELAIEGMHCGACVRRAGQALAALEGVTVEEVRVGAARIEAADEKAAIEALARAGYTARRAE